MVIFYSYVSLPEGSQDSEVVQNLTKKWARKTQRLILIKRDRREVSEEYQRLESIMFDCSRVLLVGGDWNMTLIVP